MAEKQTVATFITQSEAFLQNRAKIYTPLDTTHRQIRLVNIQPGRHDDPIHLTLHVVDLEDEPVYETISYTWEDMSHTKQVYIRDMPYNVTFNQFAALRRLRLPEETKVLWMDVICIDQVNTQERSHQVSIMGDVYTNAARTDVWLGDVDETWYKPMTDQEWNEHKTEFEKNRTMSGVFEVAPSARREELMVEFLQIQEPVERAEFILRKLASDIHVGDLPYCTYTSEQYALCRPWYDTVRVLLGILSRPWWTRVWVLQEVLLCKDDPKVLFGSHELPFNMFMTAVDRLSQHCLFDRCCMSTMLAVFFSAEVLDRLFGLNNMSIIKTANRPGHMPLHKAIQLTKERKATDIRDHVYGVLGMIRPDDRVKVDYTLTTEQVFASTSWYIFKSRDDLTWLDKGGLPGGVRTAGIPTWSVDWVDVDRAGFRHNDTFDMNEEPDWERTKYNGNLEVVANKVAQLHLVLPAVQHDEEISDCRNHYNQLWSWLKGMRNAGWEVQPTEWAVESCLDDRYFRDFFAAIFRDTMADFADSADIASKRLNNDDWDAIVEWWHLMNKCVEEGTEQVYPGSKLFSLAIAYGLHKQDATLALTLENKLCLVPESSEAGDHIYHIRGCAPPIVLREGEAEAGHFQVVGSAYLHQFMGSEGRRENDEDVIILV